MYHQQRNRAGDGEKRPKTSPGSNAAHGESPLEDRLRSMILTNSDNRSADTPVAAKPTPHPGAQHPTTASRTSAIASTTSNGPGIVNAAGSDISPASPKAARKRMNQSQRRQMSAQLSIAADPRPLPPFSSGNFASSTSYESRQYPHHQHPNQPQRHNQHQNGHYQQRQTAQRPQTAIVQPSHYSHSPMPLTGQNNGPFHPSQPRHQQSLSYQGPSLRDDQVNWRSHQSHHSRQAHHTSLSSVDSQASRNRRPHHHNHFTSHSQSRSFQANPQDIQAQSAILEQLCEQIVSSAEIEPSEIYEKEAFRVSIERMCQEALAKNQTEEGNHSDFPLQRVRLLCFGSLSSGFATKASDMDLGLILPPSIPLTDFSTSPVPRLIEKAFLDAGLGARLLSRTRVPIIKLCEKPPEQLRLGLLDERAKWEKGLLPEHDEHEADEEAVDDVESAAVNTVVAGGNMDGKANRFEEKKANHLRNDSVLDGPIDEDQYRQILDHLKQSASQTLDYYYSNAKRILRKLGGRDITYSTARDFKEKDFKILTDVCYGFVNGLADVKLRNRLLATQSLKTAHSPSQINYRSLAGVYMQTEGAALAMLWDVREILEKDSHHEEEALKKIRQFADLQNRSNFAVDLLGYNKEMQLMLENLRKIASLQVLTLEQRQYETATQYHERTEKFLFQLGGHDAASPNNVILCAIIKRYIAGIWNHETRNLVDAFSQTLDRPSLRVIARRHKSLQLALEFDKALAKDCYDEETAKQVQAYVDVLRLPLQKCELPGRRSEYYVARSPETARVILLARQLADPSKLAPNRPRDPYRDRLEFPKTGAGVQCDINFSAHLALQNTALLRCYSHTDTRVRPLVLFVKLWAKRRGINTAYRGTLSSYGYVLMMLHYLVNIAQPFVCPNLQQLGRSAETQGAGSHSGSVGDATAPSGMKEDENNMLKGRDLRFWRDEEEIKSFAARGMITQNTDSIGHLLRGFFEYYAQSNFMSTVPSKGFDWGRDVLSLRTPGGLRSKQEKGWTGARTVLEAQNQAAEQAQAQPQPPATPTAARSAVATEASPPIEPAVSQQPSLTDTANKTGASPVAAPPVKAAELKEVKHRYLFAIEDPFELEHNVARTVTHSGIVAIRDEFRRAWRIVKNMGKAGGVGVVEEDLLADVTDIQAKERELFEELLNEIHGPAVAQ
ncbi:hypothetical protein SEPCBS119000_004305 [Sporothrix epigloea]|uniref:PAP-associated domain-containing protein n=1 Tax=Sporothrix epigloea TaxID=1892477 RepID=A0ABP0DRD6_9PEZI